MSYSTDKHKETQSCEDNIKTVKNTSGGGAKFSYVFRTKMTIHRNRLKTDEKNSVT